MKNLIHVYIYAFVFTCRLTERTGDSYVYDLADGFSRAAKVTR